MRVLFVMSNYSAVSETWLRRMLDGVRPHVAAVAAIEIPRIDPELADLPHFEIARLKRGRRIVGRFADAWLYQHSTFKKFIEDNAVTHVFCHYGTLAVQLMPLFKELSIPVFVHFHGYDATFDLKDVNGALVHTSSYKQNVVELSRRAVLVANSHFTKGLLEDAGVPSDRIAVKHLGVDAQPKPRTFNTTGTVQILSVGRLVDFKGGNLAIEAFDKAGIDAQYTIIGEGPYETEIKKAYDSSPSKDRIDMVGALPFSSVKSYLEKTDIYLQHNVKGAYSNQYEAYGVSILEAMAYGIPALVTRSGGVPEVVGDLAQDLMVEPGDTDGQASMLARLAKDVDARTEIGRRCWEWVAAHRSSMAEGDRLIEILEKGQ